MLRREELTKMLRAWEDEYQDEDKCKIIKIEMELKLGKRIEDLEFFLEFGEENYQTNIM